MMPSNTINVLFPRHLIRLTADLLYILSDELAKNICNDFSIQECIPSREDALEFVVGAINDGKRSVVDPNTNTLPEISDPYTHLSDWHVASHMGEIFNQLLRLSEGDEPNPPTSNSILFRANVDNSNSKESLLKELETVRAERDRYILRMQKLEKRLERIQAIAGGADDETQ